MAPVVPLSVTRFYFLPVWSDETLFSAYSWIGIACVLGVCISRELSLIGGRHLSLAIWIELVTELGAVEGYASRAIVGGVWGWPEGLVIRVWRCW